MTKPLGQLSKAEKSEKPEKREVYWTATEKETLKETYGTEILIENGSLDEVMTTDAPSDAWIITYEIDGKFGIAVATVFAFTVLVVFFFAVVVIIFKSECYYFVRNYITLSLIHISEPTRP